MLPVPLPCGISQATKGGETVFISFSRDLSQQKKAERELQRRQKELEHSNRELEQYAWLTSHDLREPLRKILTFSDLILTRYPEGLKEEVKTYLTKIQEAGQRMGNLIEAILLYSTISENQSLFEAVDLNHVAHQVLGDLEVAIKDTGADIQLGPLPTVEAIPIQMKQLFQNLVGNAIKYRSAERKPVVSICSQSKSPGTIEIEIKDNGRGFSMQDEKKVFGLFQRLDNDKSTRGTGVGLALCKKIVLNHGGNIGVQSSPGEGSTFFVSLPIKQQR
jgi:light-regulated signal transduction histidine kinase (bacteriophytochrome)